jgi:anti-sigma28 factor (negative regulator of flagellin synthesis)
MFNLTNKTNNKTNDKTNDKLNFVGRELKIMKDGQEITIDNFDQFITVLFKTLDIDENRMNQLKKEINDKFNNPNKYEIFLNDNIRVALKGLIESDSEINALKKEFDGFFKNIEKEWNEMTENLGKLQALILLKQIRESDCSEFTKKLVDALNKKIENVNQILEQNLEVESDIRVDESIKRKYLKYKNKYLNLQKNYNI